MDLTHDDVITILRLIDESSYEELHLEVGEFRIVIKKKGPRISSGSPAAAGSVTDRNPREIRRDAPERAAPGRAGRVPGRDPKAHLLAAPVVGVFYRSPAPGEPPFVDVGSLVTEDETVGIIEVMKLMHAIKSGCRGRVVEILAENARPVEYGQPLIVIERVS